MPWATTLQGKKCQRRRPKKESGVSVSSHDSLGSSSQSHAAPLPDRRASHARSIGGMSGKVEKALYFPAKQWSSRPWRGCQSSRRERVDVLAVSSLELAHSHSRESTRSKRCRNIHYESIGGVHSTVASDAAKTCTQRKCGCEILASVCINDQRCVREPFVRRVCKSLNSKQVARTVAESHPPGSVLRSFCPALMSIMKH